MDCLPGVDGSLSECTICCPEQSNQVAVLSQEFPVVSLTTERHECWHPARRRAWPGSSGWNGATNCLQISLIPAIFAGEQFAPHCPHRQTIVPKCRFSRKELICVKSAPHYSLIRGLLTGLRNREHFAGGLGRVRIPTQGRSCETSHAEIENSAAAIVPLQGAN
jgi:hypothetical protein